MTQIGSVKRLHLNIIIFINCSISGQERKIRRSRERKKENYREGGKKDTYSVLKREGDLHREKLRKRHKRKRGGDIRQEGQRRRERKSK